MQPRKYFITKEGTSICAFGVGGAFDASKGGVVIAAAHTVPWQSDTHSQYPLVTKRGWLENTLELGSFCGKISYK